MKIYKLDIDASKPIRKVVQMQQNSTGALSVDVSNDGKYIRNLSCALYDGDTELSTYTTTDVGAGFKIDMSDETKVVKFTAKSVPTECSASYVASVGTGGPLKTIYCSKVQLEAGTYNQDEFYGISTKFGGDNQGLATVLTVAGADLSNVNFTRMVLTPWNVDNPIWFYNNEGLIPKNELIIATGHATIGRYEHKKNTGVVSSFTYPAVGYWTDYSLDTVIRPSENAHCYAEQEVADPEPEPTPDPEEPVEP